MVIERFGVAIPFWDQWNREGLFIHLWLNHQLSFSSWFEPHFEHRIFWTRLLLINVFEGNQRIWDPMLQMTVNPLIFSICLIAFFRLQYRIIGWNPLVFGITLVGLILPMAYENVLWGFQSQFYFLLLFSILFLLAYEQWLCGVLLAISAYLALGSGVLAVIAVFPVLVYRSLTEPDYRCRHLKLLTIYLLVTGVLLYAMPVVPEHQHLKAQSLAQFFSALEHLTRWPFNLPGSGFIWQLPLFIWFTCLLYRHKPLSISDRTLLALWVWCGLQIAAIAYSRGSITEIAVAQGLPPSTEGFIVPYRYLQIVFLAQIVPMLALAKWRSVWGTVVLSLATASVGLGLMQQLPDVLEKMNHRQNRQNIHLLNVQTYLKTSDMEMLRSKPVLDLPYPSADGVVSMLEALRHNLPPNLQVPTPMTGQGPGFVENGVYPTTPALLGDSWGSHTGAGDAHTGEWRSDPVELTSSFIAIPLAGYPNSACHVLELRTSDGRIIPVPKAVTPGEGWQWITLRNPGPFQIFAADRCEHWRGWFAFGTPRRIGILSVAADFARQQSSWLLLLGVTLLIFTAINAPQNAARRE